MALIFWIYFLAALFEREAGLHLRLPHTGLFREFQISELLF
jgi:hypothetical protein